MLVIDVQLFFVLQLFLLRSLWLLCSATSRRIEGYA